MSIQTAGTVPTFTLSDRLRKAREHAGLEQAELADKIGVSRNTIGNAERGQRSVRKIVVNAWAMATGVSRHWLETGQAPPELGGPADLASYTARDSNPEPIDLESPRVLTLVAA